MDIGMMSPVPSLVPTQGTEALELAKPFLGLAAKVALRAKTKVLNPQLEPSRFTLALPPESESLGIELPYSSLPEPREGEVRAPIDQGFSGTEPAAPSKSPAMVASMALTRVDSLPSLLQGVYLAPAVVHQFSGAYVNENAGASGQALLHVMAPTPISASSDPTQSRTFNSNTYALSPATPESIAAHSARIATGRPPSIQRIVSDTHEAFVGHSLDVIA